MAQNNKNAWVTLTAGNWRKILGSGKTQVPVRHKLIGGVSVDTDAMLTLPTDNVRRMGGGFMLVNEKEATTPIGRYLRLLDYCIQELGHEGPTSRQELNEFMKRELGDLFLGVFAAGEEPPFNARQPYAIVNTTNSPGEHWLAMYNDTRTEPIMYDSFGRAIFLMKPDGSLKPVHTNREPEQREGEDSCGQRCCAWLLMYKKYGRIAAKKI